MVLYQEWKASTKCQYVSEGWWLQKEERKTLGELFSWSAGIFRLDNQSTEDKPPWLTHTVERLQTHTCAQTQIHSFIHKSCSNQSRRRQPRFASTAFRISHYPFSSGLQPDVHAQVKKRKWPVWVIILGGAGVSSGLKVKCGWSLEAHWYIRVPKAAWTLHYFLSGMVQGYSSDWLTIIGATDPIYGRSYHFTYFKS